MSDLHNKQTKTVRAGIGSDESHGAVVPPLHLSSTFTFAGFEQKRAHDYSRTSNPTRATLGDALAELEQGSGGIVTASGMAACTLALQLLEPGQRLIAPHDCYGGTYRLVTALAKRGAFELELLDLSDEKTLQAALESAPRMLWIETPSNPLLRITNMALVEKAKLDTPQDAGGLGQHVFVAGLAATADPGGGYPCTRRPNTSTVIATSSGAPWSAKTPRCTKSSAGGPTAWGSRARRSIAF
jgi:hypothetical protein